MGPQRKHPYYVFSMHTMQGSRDRPQRGKRHKLVADFGILWCVNHDFYIVPRESLGMRLTICIPKASRRGSQWDRFRGRWELLGEPN